MKPKDQLHHPDVWSARCAFQVLTFSVVYGNSRRGGISFTLYMAILQGG